MNTDDTRATADNKQVEEQMKYLEDIIGGLGAQADHLIDSLSQVLSEEKPTVEDSSSEIDIILCPLAEQIRKDKHRLQRIDASLISILSRLEV